ncbi:hypothetical protein EV363DRAFT_1525718 [Boletus edulis]|nr:hypothetical protein EV363DRAFT_1525718 [Boletus edulis]
MGRSRESLKKIPQLPTSPQKHRKRSLPVSPPSSLKFIEQLKETGKEVHLKAASTRRSYAGHIKRGRAWLTEYSRNESSTRELLPWTTPDHVVSKDDPYTNPTFVHAFDRVPNEFSDAALALFLTYKGFHECLGRNTVEGVRAAFKDLWDKADSGRYRGKWQQDPVSRQWIGNPAESAEVQDILRSLKHKASSEDGNRTHSLPMTKAYMEKTLSWSLEACPLLKMALGALECAFDDMSADRDVPALRLNLKERECITRHLERIAFDATAWTLWTRCFELIKVQRKHVTMPDPIAVHSVVRKCLLNQGLVESDLAVQFEVRLVNRKGWQRRTDKGDTDLRGNRYQLYPQPQLLASDSFLWLSVWMRWLEVYHYGRKLDPDDCVFPSIGANGVMQPREPISHDSVQKSINEATTAAGILGSFSTHCFRRGGAQYRFMFAPVGERWTLAMVRWWGGWAENENRDTLIRYLLDELHTYETDYSDALAPARVQRHANDSLMGEAALIQPVSVEDVRSMMDSFGANFSDLRTHMVHVNGTVHELKDTVTVLSSRVPLSGTTTTNAPHPIIPMDHGSHASSDTRARLTIKIPPRGTASGVSTCRTRIASSSERVTRPQPTATTVARTPPSLPSAAQPHFESVQSSDSSSLSSQPGHAHVRLLPTPGLVIPDIPVRNPDGSRRPKSESWRDIVKHWTEGDPALGLHTPLKDWPPEWTRGSNRLFAAKHQQRSLIALEFTERFQSNEAMFIAAYPEAVHGHCALLRAINTTRQARGECEVRSWPGLPQLQDS